MNSPKSIIELQKGQFYRNTKHYVSIGFPDGNTMYPGLSKGEVFLVLESMKEIPLKECKEYSDFLIKILCQNKIGYIGYWGILKLKKDDYINNLIFEGID